MTSLPSDLDFGFVPIPRRLLDDLLTCSLTRNELLLALLISRLTYGCQNASLVELKLSDLSVIGVRSSHARECIDSLIEKSVLKKEGKRRYRLMKALAPRVPSTAEKERILLLKRKVNEQLLSFGEKPESTKVPKTGT